jgi:hypothetical protein
VNPGTPIRIWLSLTIGGLLLAGLLLLSTWAPVKAVMAAGDLFVTPDGGGSCSQAAPCDLPTALGLASAGDAIYMAGGAYTAYTAAGEAVISVTHSIALYGGWDGAAAGAVVRDPAAHPTTIDGQGARRGVAIGDGLTVTLDGFTIANGTAPGTGAGLIARNASLILRQMAFLDNVIDIHSTPDSYAYGAGAYVEGGTLFIEECTFQRNSAWASSASNGGGLYVFQPISVTVLASLFQDNDAWFASGLQVMGATDTRVPVVLRQSTFRDNGWGNASGRGYGGYAGAVTIENAQAQIEDNTFAGNRAINDYGAAQIARSDLRLDRNVFVDNESDGTAALTLFDVWPLVAANNLFADNRSNYALNQSPTIFLGGSHGDFLHNTVARNSSARGLTLQYGSTLAITNTILVSHTVGIYVNEGCTANLEGALWGEGAWANGVDWDGAGDISTGAVNIWGDPAFVDPDGGDYHITAPSAARDAGIFAGAAIDIDGDWRPMGMAPDIGADEFEDESLLHVCLPLLMRAANSPPAVATGNGKGP